MGKTICIPVWSFERIGWIGLCQNLWGFLFADKFMSKYVFILYDWTQNLQPFNPKEDDNIFAIIVIFSFNNKLSLNYALEP